MRVTFNRRRKYYSIGRYFSTEEFQKLITTNKPRKEQKEHRNYFYEFEKKAIDIIATLRVFSFPAFDQFFISKQGDKFDVFRSYQVYIRQLKNVDRIGTAVSYENSLNSLQRFTGCTTLKFDEVTVHFLEKYEKWMLSQDDGNSRKVNSQNKNNVRKRNSLTTVGIYLRCLRKLFRDAIEDNVIKAEHYPFGKNHYVIPSGSNKKKALSLDQIELLYNYSAPDGSLLQRSLDVWLFSYLCNGINVKDIAKLKYKNVQNGEIRFIRSKTERTNRRNLKDISAVTTPEVKCIIDRWGNKPVAQENYIFPILKDGMTAEQEHIRVKSFTKQMNNHLKKIATELGLTMDLSTYYARHSWATVLKRSGAPTEFISEQLGHTSLSTTENYLDSFEKETRVKYADALLDFKK